MAGALAWGAGGVCGAARADDAWHAPMSVPSTRTSASATAAPASSTEGGPDVEPPIVHTLIFLTTLRTIESVLYPLPFAQAKDVGFHYKESFTRPPLFDADAPAFEWDHDPWTINVIGHGLMGSELYLRARSCRFGALGSLAFAAGSTVLWEYGFEGNGVRPSALDLVYTPLSGLVLGEGRYQAARVTRRLDPSFGRSALLALLDPFGEAERGALDFRC